MPEKEGDLIVLENLITKLNELISFTKVFNYWNNSLLQVNTYWSILKTFYNDKKFH